MLLSDYLAKRSQFTICNDVASNESNIVFGGRQGSNLRPLLFLIYINDLPIHTKFSVRMFADDTVLFIRNQNLNKLEKIVSTELL